MTQAVARWCGEARCARVGCRGWYPGTVRSGPLPPGSDRAVGRGCGMKPAACRRRSRPQPGDPNPRPSPARVDRRPTAADAARRARHRRDVARGARGPAKRPRLGRRHLQRRLGGAPHRDAGPGAHVGGPGVPRAGRRAPGDRTLAEPGHGRAGLLLAHDQGHGPARCSGTWSTSTDTASRSPARTSAP